MTSFRVTKFRVFMAVLVLAILALIVKISLYSYALQELYNSPLALTVGPFNEKNSHDLVVVEFYDYSCIYCRRAQAPLMQAIREDGHVALIPRAVNPFDDPKAALFSRAAIAAGAQNAFLPMHERLLEDFETLTQQDLPMIAAALAIDAERLKADMQSQEVEDIFNRHQFLFRHAANQIGTPSFFISRQILFIPQTRFPDAQDFKKMFAEARALQ